MANPIKETRSTRSIRFLVKSVFLISIFWGIAFVLICLILEEWASAAGGLVLTFLAFYFYKRNRVAAVVGLASDSVMLRDGKKIIQLKRECIEYVFKNFRYTFTDRFMLIIATKNGTLLTRQRYLVVNEPSNDLMGTFLKMKVPMKNFDVI